MPNRQRAALRSPVVAPPTQGYKTPSRAGKRGVTFYLPAEQWRQLRRLAVDTDATIQSLMEDAVALLLGPARNEVG
jgi:hypothetical protein